MKQAFIARLRQRITLQQPDLTAGAGGQFSVAWENVATVWAEVTPLENRSASAEDMFAEQLVSRVTHAVTLRYREGVSAEMRIAYRGRYFNIRHVVNTGERNEMLRLLVEEHAAS